MTNYPYIINKEIDFEEYFDDVIGVTIPCNKPLCEIILRFSSERFPYIISKPLHGSMKVVDKEKCIIKLTLIPNNEFISLILSFGDDVELLSPRDIREQIKSKMDNLAAIYSTCAR